MRFLMIVKASAESEAGAMPNPELIEAMGRFNNEMIAAGVMLDAAGLRPSAEGARVLFQRGKPIVTDGPFTETKELIGGYWVIQAASLEEAIGWARRAPFEEGQIEIRPFFEPEAFAGVASDEMIAQEQGWREEQARKAPKA